MPSGASSPGPGAGRVMGPDCVPTLLRVSRVTGQNCPQCPEVPRVVSSPCRPRIDTQEAQSHTVHKCPPGPQPPTPCLLPGAVRNAGSQRADLEDPTVGRIEAALRPRFRREPWEAHPKRGPRVLVPATGQPQGRLLLGDSLSRRSSSGAPQPGPSGCSHLCPSSGVSATPAAVVPQPTAGPPEAHGPRGIYIPVCPQPAPARRHPEPVCKRNWTPRGAEVQGGTHQAPFLGVGHAPDLRASAGLSRAVA